MASRAAVSQGIQGDEVIEEKKVVVPDVKNRRVLGDIGNVVTLRAYVPNCQSQICRPLTRGFCARLLANVQAAEGKRQKDDEAPIADGKLGKKAGAPKAASALARTTTKPKSTEVIEISLDTQETKNVEHDPGSSRKNAAYSSVLTARSKAACPRVLDIDSSDVDTDLAGVEYVEDIYAFYKSVEIESQPRDYISSQPEINEKMRAILVDWLIEVHAKFELSLEAFYLTVNIIDRFLSAKSVSRRNLQLIGLSALLISSKYEEIWPPQVRDLVYISDYTYNEEQILSMEKSILAHLEWYLTVPTPFVFLARFTKASIPDKEMENMVHFLGELGVVWYDTLKFSPSMVAASAVYAARCALKKCPNWTPTLEHYTGYSETQLVACARLLAFYHSRASDNKLKAAYRKYSKPERGAVSLIPAANSLLS